MQRTSSKIGRASLLILVLMTSIRMIAAQDGVDVTLFAASVGTWLANPPVAHAQGLPPSRIRSIAWSPDGALIAVAEGPDVCDPDNLDSFPVNIIDAASGSVVRRITPDVCATSFVSWSPTGDRLVTSQSLEGSGLVWDTATGQFLIISEMFSPVDRFADVWSPVDDRIANISLVTDVHVWNASTGETVASCCTGDQTSDPLSVGWSPDGSKLVVGGFYGDVSVWDAGTFQLLLLLEGHTNNVWSVDWSPDGSRIASGSRDDTIRIWDASTGAELLVLPAYSNINQVVWRADGDCLASGGDDGAVRVWSANTGQQVALFQNHEPVYAVDWSPDGSQLAYSGPGNTVQIIPAPLAHPDDGGRSDSDRVTITVAGSAGE